MFELFWMLISLTLNSRKLKIIWFYILLLVIYVWNVLNINFFDLKYQKIENNLILHFTSSDICLNCFEYQMAEKIY